MDVNLLRGIELTSSSTIWTVGVLAVLTAVVAAVILLLAAVMAWRHVPAGDASDQAEGR